MTRQIELTGICNCNLNFSAFKLEVITAISTKESDTVLIDVSEEHDAPFHPPSDKFSDKPNDRLAG